ncbi:hypothetical protein [Streptacidiphilus carbonis]|uniref:hypothetical protein n=1 Tax=Streptacidiphilus carbonis TaxID=105422 RepID=UPI0005AA59E9|nr:hypothetical protein [Streptacidiphilus carbonis]
MAVTLSLAFIFAVITGALIAAKRISAPAALFVWLSGFTLAGTSWGAPGAHFLASLISAIHH